jgi:hypothetical protein
MNLALLVDQRRRMPGLTWDQHGLLHGCSATEAREAWLQATRWVGEQPEWWDAARALYAEGFSYRQIGRMLGKHQKSVGAVVRSLAA